MGTGRIQAKRKAAERARQLVLAVSQPEDRQRILAYAAELDEQADGLERALAATAPPQVRQVQQQQQQQADQKPPAKDPPEKSN